MTSFRNLSLTNIFENLCATGIPSDSYKVVFDGIIIEINRHKSFVRMTVTMFLYRLEMGGVVVRVYRTTSDSAHYVFYNEYFYHSMLHVLVHSCVLNILFGQGKLYAIFT